MPFSFFSYRKKKRNQPLSKGKKNKTHLLAKLYNASFLSWRDKCLSTGDFPKDLAEGCGGNKTQRTQDNDDESTASTESLPVLQFILVHK